MGIDILVLVVCILAILGGAELFTNGIEWLGRRLRLGEGVTGSVLAAVGTALPETIIPLIAIVFGEGAAHDDIGVGAILGAPFMLSTAAFFVTGIAVFIFAARRGRATKMNVNTRILGRDLRFFLIVYALAIGATALPWHAAKVGLAVFLLALYGFYVWRTLQDESHLGEDLAPLHFHREAEEPHTWRIVAQVGVSLLVIIVGARFFVNAMEDLATMVGMPPLILALIVAPLATELPEKFNSVLWVRQRKDTLAMGNITGAMVFQSCIPVSVGLVLTPWELSFPAVVSALIALASSAIVFAWVWRRRVLTPHILVASGVLYFAYLAFVLTTQA